MRLKYLASIVAALAASTLLFSACSSSGGGKTSSSAPAGSSGSAGGGSGSSSTKAASGTPIQLGMINQENTPAGSFPDVRQGAQAAVSYINSIGGLNGRPLKLTPCITDASPSSGANCSRQLIGDKVVAVIGGEDFSTSGSIPPLASAKIPYVGGIPILPAESTSSISFQFSGGSSGAFTAQDQYIAQTIKAKKVNIITTANPAGLAAATVYGSKILAKLGVTDVKSVQAAADAADFTAPVQQIVSNNPGAVMVLFGSPACSRIMQAMGSLGFQGKVFYPGSCLTASEVKAGGNGANGALFNSDNMLFSGDDSQVVLWRAQMKKYQPSATLSAYSQNGFQSVYNLWEAMKKGPANPTSASIISTLESSVNVPSFMGHPYTCNHKIVSGAPAICSSAQRIIEYKDGKFTDILNKWVDGGKLAG